ncbi:MAG: nucleotide pyrophosphohydrolase [Candidatus Bathyarchaeota archaeon]|nr:nucleotide pyrophosphohydrolase [Candidatus Bathyarchaeota archaeon]
MHIREFQEMMRSLYFHRDFARGVKGTYDWLIDEINELGEAIEDGSDREVIANEFADAIAWLASLANLMGIDLESAAINKYSYKCPKCRQAPCVCRV